MATTTNFGWETPDDTDLVKDGAAAIRTALGGVDTSFVDLKGGTTGQVLAKASGTDLDFTWSNDSGISPTIVDAKGDLITATAADTPARVAVGTNGQVLTADSSAATGLTWTSPSSGSMTSLATGSLTGTTVTINSISSAYTDLRLVIKNPVPGSAYIGMLMRVNSDTGSNYVDQNWSAGTTNRAKGSSMYLAGQLPATTNEGVIIVELFRYATTSQWRLMQSNYIGRSADSSTTADIYNYRMAWANTADAITSISLFLGSGSFSSGTYELFGVK